MLYVTVLNLFFIFQAESSSAASRHRSRAELGAPFVALGQRVGAVTAGRRRPIRASGVETGSGAVLSNRHARLVHGLPHRFRWIVRVVPRLKG
jgi:hypothetical protein